MDKQIVECARCGRKLKSPKAVELGYGPVCRAKTLAEAEENAQQEYEQEK